MNKITGKAQITTTTDLTDLFKNPENEKLHILKASVFPEFVIQDSIKIQGEAKVGLDEFEALKVAYGK